MDPKARKCFVPAGESKPGRPARNPWLYQLSYQASNVMFRATHEYVSGFELILDLKSTQDLRVLLFK
jgi:hypothetical protein